MVRALAQSSPPPPQPCAPIVSCAPPRTEYNNSTGLTCGYHYTSAGYAYLTDYLAPLYHAQLATTTPAPRITPEWLEFVAELHRDPVAVVAAILAGSPRLANDHVAAGLKAGATSRM